MTKSIKLLKCGMWIFCVALLGCHPFHEASQTPVSKEASESLLQTSAKTVTLQILDESQTPVAGAQVLVGPREGVPSRGNFLTTDDQGKVQIEAWFNPLPVTIGASGFIRTTYDSQTADDHTYVIKAVPTSRRYLIKGQVNGYGSLKRDGRFDIALVLPAFLREEIFSLRLENLVSPEMDTISIYGKQVSLPSNIAFPQQSEFYKLFLISLNKPTYRIFTQTPGPKHLVAAHASFPVKEVLNGALDGQPFWSLTNFFHIHKGALTSLSVIDDVTPKDLNVDQYQFPLSLSVQAPLIANDESLFAVSLSLAQNLYIPTDLKKLESGKMMSMQFGDFGAASTVLFLAKTQDLPTTSDLSALRFSLTFVENISTSPAQPHPLGLLALPVSQANGNLKVSPPDLKEDVKPMALYAKLSALTPSDSKAELESQTPFWEYYSPQWGNEIQLPQWPQEKAQPILNHGLWEVSYWGSSQDSDHDLGPGMTKNLTHLSYGQVKF